MGKPTEDEPSTERPFVFREGEREVLAFLRHAVRERGVDLSRVLEAWVIEEAHDGRVRLADNGIAYAHDDDAEMFAERDGETDKAQMERCAGYADALTSHRERVALHFLLRHGQLQAAAQEQLDPDAARPGVFPAWHAADLAADLGAFAHGWAVTKQCAARAERALGAKAARWEGALALAIQAVVLNPHPKWVMAKSGAHADLVPVILDCLTMAIGSANVPHPFVDRRAEHMAGAANILEGLRDRRRGRYRIKPVAFGEGAKIQPGRGHLSSFGVALRFAAAFGVEVPESHGTLSSFERDKAQERRDKRP